MNGWDGWDGWGGFVEACECEIKPYNKLNKIKLL